MITFHHPGYTMKLKIVSDGTAHGTKLVHVETGEVLADVMSVNFAVNSDHAMNAANIQLVGIAAEMVGELKTVLQTDDTTKKPLPIPERTEGIIYLNDFMNKNEQ